jgi:hypothetical protein
MKRLVITFLTLIFACGIHNAQEVKNDTVVVKKYSFRYSVNKESLSAIDIGTLSSHPLGETIARKLFMLQDLYTYVEPATPTSPSEKTIVLKPYIYNPVLKLNRYFKKQVKNGIITRDDAIKDLNYCLDVAISVVADQTDSLEADLRKAADLTEMIRIFSGVELLK